MQEGAGLSMKRDLQNRVCWFSFVMDGLPLMQSVTCAQETMPPGTTFHVFDQATKPLDAAVVNWLRDRGVSVQRTTFDRRWNLNGAVSICGELECFASVCRADDEIIWKVDCDTLVLRPEVYLKEYRKRAEVNGVGPYCPRAVEGWWGICYTLRGRMIGPMHGLFQRTCQLTRLAEDIYLSRAIIRNSAAADTVTLLTGHEGGAYMSYNWKTGLTAEEYIRRFDVVTFGNRGQMRPLNGWQMRQKQAAMMALFNERALK